MPITFQIMYSKYIFTDYRFPQILILELTLIKMSSLQTKSISDGNKVVCISVSADKVLLPSLSFIIHFYFLTPCTLRFWNLAAGNAAIQPQEHTEVRHWCWGIRSGSQLVYQFIRNLLDGVEVGALCRPLKFFHTNLEKHLFFSNVFLGHFWNFLIVDRVEIAQRICL